METNPLALTAKEFCRILDTCHKTGVLKLRLGELEVEFGARVAPGSTKVLDQTPEVMSDLGSDNHNTGSKEIEPPKDLLTVADKESLEDLARSQLLMDDPTGFEQVMIDDHLKRPGAVAGEAS